jgi:hypothetical protein
VFTEVLAPTDRELPADDLDRLAVEITESDQAEASRFVSRFLSLRADGVDRGQKCVAECASGGCDARAVGILRKLCEGMRLERGRIVKTNERPVYAFAEDGPARIFGWGLLRGLA